MMFGDYAGVLRRFVLLIMEPTTGEYGLKVVLGPTSTWDSMIQANYSQILRSIHVLTCEEYQVVADVQEQHQRCRCTEQT